jgi:NTP pyrophosphatase (non-canonical NTP hydrolase)
MLNDEYDVWIAERWNGQQPAQQPKGEIPYSPVAAMGLAGETGEVMELLKKHWRDGKHPGEDMLLELGDVLHYLLVIAHAYGWTLGDLMEANVTKLTKRDAKRGLRSAE